VAACAACAAYLVAGLCLGAFVWVGCTDPRPAAAPTITEMPDASRRPDGILLETPPAIPSANDRAEARGVVALREPLGVDAVRDVVMALVRAFVREDIGALDALLADGAVPLEGAGRGSRATLIERWRQRMQQVEYSRLGGVEVVRPEKIQHFEYDEMGGADEPARPPEMKRGDVFARVPLEVSRIGPDKFFGDTWLLILRRSDATHYKVAAFGEVDGHASSP
jgi:hypothetical protein